MNFNQNLKISKDVLSQQVSGETVLLDLNSENYFGLDQIGTRIWQLLQEHGDVQKIYDTLLEEYDVDAELLKKDLGKMITKLNETGLIALNEE